MPVKPILLGEVGGAFNAIVAMIWEDAGGELALRFDPRYKVLVLRRAAVPWSLSAGPS